jgi:hypothetical protein
VVLPVMAGGVYLIIHGEPDVEDHERRRIAAAALAGAREEGWVDLWAILAASDMDRTALEHSLAAAAQAARQAAYVDWRRGVLSVWPADSPADRCPACTEPLPDGQPPLVCGACRIEILARP